MLNHHGAPFRLNGMPVYSTPHLQPNHTAVELPPVSGNRSPRLIKKLMQRVRQKSYAVWTEVLMIRDPLSGQSYLACHPTVYRQLVSQIENGAHA